MSSVHFKVPLTKRFMVLNDQGMAFPKSSRLSSDQFMTKGEAQRYAKHLAETYDYDVVVVELTRVERYITKRVTTTKVVREKFVGDDWVET